MKKTIRIIILLAIFILFIAFGYDRHYGFYSRNELHIEERLKAHALLSENFELQINSASFGQEYGKYFIIINGTLKNISKHTYENISFFPRLDLHLDTGDNFDFYSIDIKSFNLGTLILNPNSSTDFSKKLYFNEEKGDFNPEYLKYAMKKVILGLSLDAESSIGGKITNQVNIQWSEFVEKDVKVEFSRITN